MTNKIMEYLQDTFNCEFNHFTYNTFENMIDYAVNNFNNSKNQLAYYLSDIIDELEFEEIKKEIMRYIDNNLSSEYVGDRIDVILRILYQLEEYFDFKNETIEKVINLIQNESILMN